MPKIYSTVELCEMFNISKQALSQLRTGFKQIKKGKSYEAPAYLIEGEDYEKKSERVILFYESSIKKLKKRFNK